MFVFKVRVRVEHVKGLPGSNGLAFFVKHIKDVKRFTTLIPGHNVIKLFRSVIYKYV